jgi:hypothetical protein
MIQLTVPKSNFETVSSLIDNKVKQMDIIVSPMSLTEISKAIFTITTKKFLKDLSIASLQDPKKYHHLYEWGEIGKENRKLFLLKRSSIRYGNLTIDIVPLKSTKPVPINSALSVPGATGKKVTSKSIFKNKMEIMEENNPIHIITKKTIVFSPDGRDLVFVPAGRVIDIMNPGGVKTTHALRDFSKIWYDTKAPIVINNSRLIQQIGNEVAKVINTQGSSKDMVYKTIKMVSSKYSQDRDVV